MTFAKRWASIQHHLNHTRTWFMFALLFLMVPVFSVTVIKIHEPQMQQQTFDNLLAIAKLKAYQIDNWLTEQDKVAKVVATNKVMIEYVNNLLNGINVSKQKVAISELLNALVQFYGYESIQLVRPDGSELIAVGNDHKAGQDIIAKSLSTHAIQRSDIVFEADGSSHLDVAIPLMTQHGDNRVKALVLLHLNPNSFIFPYLQQWPTASSTSETLLVRQVNHHVDFISARRLIKEGTVIDLKSHSIDESELPAAVALKNHITGIMSGKDYRGVDVLAAYYPIKDSQWMIVAKIDKKEATQTLNDLVFWISLVAFLCLMMIGFAFLVVLDKQKRLQVFQLLAKKTESERVLQKFYDLPFIGMAIIDSNHEKWTRFNDRFQNMLGYSQEALKNKIFSDILHPQEKQVFNEKFLEVSSKQTDGFTRETRLLRADGGVVFGIVNIKCIRRTNGDVQYFLLTVQDMTELKQLGELYIDRQNHLNTLINTIPDLIWLKDINGIYLSCNPSFESMYGAKESNIVGKSDYDFVDKALADFFREHDLKAMEAGVPSENEEWLTFADTGYRGLFSTIKTPMKDERGNVIGVLGVARDITKRKEDELRLQRLTKLYSALSQTNESIIQCDTEQELFDRVCDIAVTYGDMKMAWIGKVDESSKQVYPVAWAGDSSDYLQGISISIEEDNEVGRGPTGTAARSDSPYWCQDFQHDENTKPWHERGKEYGWMSSASIPLHQRFKVIGTLTLYSDVIDAFDEPVQNLLVEMAADISFALNNYASELERKQIAVSRQEALERLQKLAERLPGMIYQFRLMPDGRTCLPFASDAIESVFHLKPEDVVDDASKVFDVIYQEDLEAVRSSIQESAEKLTPWHQEFRVQYDSGDIRWLSANAMPQSEAEGAILWHGFITDITERKQAENQIELASKVFEQSREGIMITDPDLNILMVNDAFTQITGYSSEEALGQTPKLLASGSHDKEFYESLWLKVHQERHWQGEVWNRRKNGEHFPEWLSINTGYDSEGKVTEYIGVFTDLSKIKESEEKIQRLAHYDSLTNLANRELLMERMAYSLNVAEKAKTSVALLFIDLDNFKNINDTLGHHVGDHLLIEVGNRISGILKPEDILARQGGDEFIAVLPGADESEAAHLAEKILKIVSSEMIIDSFNLQITPSIGISIFPQDGTDANSLLKNADTAMYQAKSDGRNTYRFFTMAMQEHASHIMWVESALRIALIRDEFELYYQPQVSAVTNQVIGAEALIRWNHPDMGMILPVNFIPIAEQSALILEIGSWVMKAAIKQIKAWKEQGLPLLTIAVNLSAAQFRIDELPQQVVKLLAEQNVEPERLEVELTETVAMSNPEAAIQMINKFASYGIKIAIDDFGTGYSSLSYLKKFKANKLKIDQSFVRDLMSDGDDRSIVEAIISMAQSLGLKTIAEGVETNQQLQFLKDNQCDEIQGYFYAKPMPADAFVEFLLRNQSLPIE